MKFGLNHAPGAGLLTRPADLQSNMLLLCYDYPHHPFEIFYKNLFSLYWTNKYIQFMHWFISWAIHYDVHSAKPISILPNIICTDNNKSCMQPVQHMYWRNLCVYTQEYYNQNTAVLFSTTKLLAQDKYQSIQYNFLLLSTLYQYHEEPYTLLCL